MYSPRNSFPQYSSINVIIFSDTSHLLFNFLVLLSVLSLPLGHHFSDDLVTSIFHVRWVHFFTDKFTFVHLFKFSQITSKPSWTIYLHGMSSYHHGNRLCFFVFFLGRATIPFRTLDSKTRISLIFQPVHILTFVNVYVQTFFLLRSYLPFTSTLVPYLLLLVSFQTLYFSGPF